MTRSGAVMQVLFDPTSDWTPPTVLAERFDFIEVWFCDLLPVQTVGEWWFGIQSWTSCGMSVQFLIHRVAVFASPEVVTNIPVHGFPGYSAKSYTPGYLSISQASGGVEYPQYEVIQLIKLNNLELSVVSR